MIDKDRLTIELTHLQNVERRVKKMMADAPKGRFFIRKQGEYRYLSRIIGSRSDGTRRIQHLSMKTEEGRRALNGLYGHMLLPAIQKERAALQTFLNDYSPLEKASIINAIPPKMRQYLHDPFAAEFDAEEWAAEPFPSNPYPIDECADYTDEDGRRFRSKAEFIIASLLKKMKLPYRYECLLCAGDRDYYPDFTVMRPDTRELFYIEYFGLMDDPDYAKAAMKKIEQYQLEGPQDHFIYFFEARYQPMNIPLIEKTLKRRLLENE